jgi:hypothetical protein
MDNSTFKDWMLRADTLRRVSLHSDDAEFWAGYMRGLRRLYHGEKFGTEDDHQSWMNIERDEYDLTRRSKGEGYRAGFAGIDPVGLFRTINGEYLTCQELAKKTGVGGSRIRQIALAIPGGWLSDGGWRFPVSAVEYVESLPGRGRPKLSKERPEKEEC